MYTKCHKNKKGKKRKKLFDYNPGNNKLNEIRITEKIQWDMSVDFTVILWNLFTNQMHPYKL